MRRAVLWLLTGWAVVLAQPPADSVPASATSGHPLLRFTLRERPADLSARFGQEPSMVHGRGWRVLQYHELPFAAMPGAAPLPHGATTHAGCDGVFAWSFYQDVTTGELLTATFAAPTPLPRARLFPPAATRLAERRQPGGTARLLVRELDGDRVLIANISDPQQTRLDQLVVLRRAALARFYPWAVPSTAD